MDNMKFLDLYKRISDRLNYDDNLVDADLILEIQDRYVKFSSSYEEIMNENRLLKIGVVGEVKAGKSSFLNAMLFDGQDFLPKAATPMTAALTRIKYSKQNQVKVVFYETYDWDNIVRLADAYYSELDKLFQEWLSTQSDIIKNKEYNNEYKFRIIGNRIPERYRACQELVQMAEKSNIDIDSYLGTSKVLQISNIRDDLADYVAANGKYTPLVKNIELDINSPMLDGYEIVDTPGMNDPIISRGDKTKAFLMNCDIIFLLSYTSQFLNREDIEFLVNSVPADNIQRAVLIGSKFDSVLLDYPTKRGQTVTFVQALKGTVQKLNEQARTNIAQCIKDQGDYRSVALTALQSSLPPMYISSIIYSIARKLEQNKALDSNERKIFDNLQNRFVGFKTDTEFLKEFANIEATRDKHFANIKVEKNRIMEEKRNNLFQSELANFLLRLENINIQARKNLADLQKYDKEGLEKKLRNITEKMNSMRVRVRDIFDNSTIDTKKYINSIIVEVAKEANNHNEIVVTTRTEHRIGSYEEGWFIFKKTKHYQYTETIFSAGVQDVINNIRGYIASIQEEINSGLDHAVDTVSFKSKIKQCVIGAFDLTGTDFDEDEIIGPVDKVLNNITYPKILLDNEKYNQIIMQSFSCAYVEGNQIHELKTKQSLVLSEIAKDAQKELDKLKIEIENIMNRESAIFVDNVIRRFTANIQMIEQHLKNKEDIIKKYNNLLMNLDKWKKEVNGVR